MESELKKILDLLLVENNDFEDYVNNRCINALNKYQEYIDSKCNENYTDDELTVMKENYLFKAGLFSGIQMFYNLNKQ